MTPDGKRSYSVKKLKDQDIKLYSIDAPALVNVIASGEIIASPAIFQSHTVLAASKGAPGGVGSYGSGS